MKKVYFSLFVLAAAICWGQSKTTVQTFNGKTGWKKTSQTTVAQNTQTRHVEPYDEILVEGNFEVTLVQGNEGEIHLEGPYDLIEDTVVKNTKNGVRIYYKHWTKMKKNPRISQIVRVRIPVEYIAAVSLSGSGSIKSAFSLASNTLKSRLSGSGSIALTLANGFSSSELSGSGTIALKGNTQSLKARLSGSGIINCKNLVSSRAEAQLSGSGTIKLQATQSIVSNISGSGHVNVYGNPPRIETNHVGSGKTRFMTP